MGGVPRPTSVDFAGRAAEIRLLDRVLAATRGGSGRLVAVTGPPGVGKSAFCREVVRRARSDGFATAWGGCWPEGGAPPLWPWPAILDALTEGLGRRLLGDDPGGIELDPERFTRFTAVVAALTGPERQQPTIVVLDDVHAADAGALLLARFVARHLAGAALSLMLSGREPARDLLSGWDVGELAVPLGGLDAGAAAELLRLRDCTLADDMLSLTVRLTGGNPLHLQRIAYESLDGTGRIGPEGLESAVHRSVAGLSADARRSLGRCAVLGSNLTVAEAIGVAEVPATVMTQAVREAVDAGLVTCEDREPDRFAFGHEMIREAFEALMGPAEAASTHARAAAALALGPRNGLQSDAAHRSTRLARHAHHALRAAHRSPEDARIAVAAGRTAARAMIAGFGYEEAASLLAKAVATAVQAGLDDPVAALLVEHAEAVLMCGRLAESRILFGEAVSAAVREDDVVCLARATLGLGGVWVNEHRTQLDWERVVGWQRQALARLGPDQDALRHRIRVRLAVEELYRGGPIEPVLAALDEARRYGDGRVLAEALSLCHHSLLTARHTRRRLALAEELIAVAAPAGEGLLALMGLCWRTVDLFQLGDPRATRSLTELRERAEGLGCLSIVYVAEAMSVMQLIRAGRLAQAEERAQACYRLGLEVGDADATGYLVAQLTTIRWFQGREAELMATMEQLAGSATLNPAEFGFQATLAQMAARAGDLEQARSVLDRLGRGGLEALPDSSTWLAGMLAIAETARILDDADTARQAYRLLSPYADLPIMPSLAVTCLGSVHRPLGSAALAFGDLERGVAHLEQAVVANRQLGNRPVAAVTRADLAEAYLRRRAPGDRERAIRQLTLAADEAAAMGLTGYGATWRRSLASLADQSATIDHHGSQWLLTLGDRQAVVADRLGVRYLAQMLINPGQALPAHVLAAGAGTATVSSPTPQPVLDSRAKAEYRRRVRDLTAAIDRADERNDPHEADRLRSEQEEIFAELRRVTGRGGQSRAFANQNERARTAVRKALVRAIDEITAVEPTIGERIRTTVTTGTTCCYTPDRDCPVRWRSTISPVSLD